MTNLIPVVVLKNFEPQLSYILVEIFNMCLKGSCFPDCWNISSVVSVFKNVGKRSTAKNYCQLLANYQYVSLLSVVSKVFEKLVNKCGLFSDFKYCFRSSESTADLLRVISDRIARAFMRSGATRAVALNISKDFCRAWHAGLQQHNSYGMLVQIFGLVSSLFSNRPVWSSQEYPVNAGIFQGLILGLALFLLYIDLYSKCDQASSRIDL